MTKEQPHKKQESVGINKAEKIERAKAVRDLMLECHRKEERTKIYWENVYYHALRILKD